jgi:hypothetical protein
MERLFGLFWLGYCVIVPAGARWLPGVRALAERVGLPLVPLGIGLVCALNYGIHKAHERTMAPVLGWPNAEIKETGFALVFCVIGLYFLRSSDAHREVARPHGASPSPV